jgi:hypothetical protein
MHRTAYTIAAALLVMLGVWWWAREPDADSTATAQIAASRPASGAKKLASNAAHADDAAQADEEETPDDHPAGSAPPDYRARLLASDDYWEFANSVYAAARQGDPAAQYYLYSALTYCESLYDWYFVDHLAEGKTRHRTLDEAQQLTVTRKVFTPDDVRDIQKRCARLRTSTAEYPPYGKSGEWLEAAIASGYPLAQAQAALSKALNSQQVTTPDNSGATRDEARRLAMEALRNRDPLVMAQMGDVAANLAADDPAESRKQQWMWPLAACLRETKCDSMAEWMRIFCNIDTQCQPFETPIDVIRRQAGNDFYEIERRARELNEKLDAGTLTASDIGNAG